MRLSAPIILRVLPGRKTSGHLPAVGTYATDGVPLEEAVPAAGLDQLSYIFDSGRARRCSLQGLDGGGRDPCLAEDMRRSVYSIFI